LPCPPADVKELPREGFINQDQFERFLMKRECNQYTKV
jgi:hypothetical protein